jgi:hypothetical protein
VALSLQQLLADLAVLCLLLPIDERASMEALAGIVDAVENCISELRSESPCMTDDGGSLGVCLTLLLLLLGG